MWKPRGAGSSCLCANCIRELSDVCRNNVPWALGKISIFPPCSLNVSIARCPFLLAACWAFCAWPEIWANGPTGLRKLNQFTTPVMANDLIWISLLSLDAHFHATLRNIESVNAAMFCHIVLKWAKKRYGKQQEDLKDRERKRNCIIFVSMETHSNMICFILSVHSK